MAKYLRVEMSDGSTWDVPVSVILASRKKYYVEQVGESSDSMDKEHAEIEDYDIKDWAAGNMNWSDVMTEARRVADGPPLDFQQGWLSGNKRIVEKP